MIDFSSVLMDEAATLAIAAAITDRLHLQHTNFLCDNQDIVHFLNSSYHSNPPDWKIKHLITQHFINYTQQRSTGTFESAFAPYVSFGALMTSKLGTNEILMRYIAALVP